MVDEDKLNMQIRKFLKEVGVTSQREIEKAVMALEDAGALETGTSVKAVMTLKIDELDLEHTVEGDISL